MASFAPWAAALAGFRLVRERPFEELWNGEAMRSFRASLAKDGLFPYCSRCCELYEMDES